MSAEINDGRTAALQIQKPEVWLLMSHCARAVVSGSLNLASERTETGDRWRPITAHSNLTQARSFAPTDYDAAGRHGIHLITIMARNKKMGESLPATHYRVTERGVIVWLGRCVGFAAVAVHVITLNAF